MASSSVHRCLKIDYDELNNTLRDNDIADRPENLTDGEAAYIGRFDSLDAFRNKIAATKHDQISNRDEEFGADSLQNLAL